MPPRRIAIALCFGALLIAQAACVTPTPVQGSDDAFASLIGDREPWQSSTRTPSIASRPPAEVWAPLPRARANHSNFVEFGYWFYSNYLTKVDGARCEHRPTCSRYGVEAMRAHGFVVGSWLTVDRLMRTSSSSSLRTLPILKYYEGQPYFADPLHENDFFF